jgi:hypothetical protein
LTSMAASISTGSPSCSGSTRPRQWPSWNRTC